MCTTEFIGFAKAADTFTSMKCELPGLSIDSLFSHLAWTRNMQQKFGVKALCAQGLLVRVDPNAQHASDAPTRQQHEPEEHHRPLRVAELKQEPQDV